MSHVTHHQGRLGLRCVCMTRLMRRYVCDMTPLSLCVCLSLCVWHDFFVTTCVTWLTYDMTHLWYSAGTLAYELMAVDNGYVPCAWHDSCVVMCVLWLTCHDVCDMTHLSLCTGYVLHVWHYTSVILCVTWLMCDMTHVCRRISVRADGSRQRLPSAIHLPRPCLGSPALTRSAYISLYLGTCHTCQGGMSRWSWYR